MLVYFNCGDYSPAPIPCGPQVIVSMGWRLLTLKHVSVRVSAVSKLRSVLKELFLEVGAGKRGPTVGSCCPHLQTGKGEEPSKARTGRSRSPDRGTELLLELWPGWLLGQIPWPLSLPDL